MQCVRVCVCVCVCICMRFVCVRASAYECVGVSVCERKTTPLVGFAQGRIPSDVKQERSHPSPSLSLFSSCPLFHPSVILSSPLLSPSSPLPPPPLTALSLSVRTHTSTSTVPYT